MTDPGLNNRLRQRSRRAGLMVGVTMALTILICVGGSAAIYAGLVPFLSDFVPAERTRAEPPPTAVVAQTAPPPSAVVAQTAPQPAVAPPQQAVQPPAVAPPPETDAAPTATEEAFEPTHQIVGGGAVNLRPQPSSENTADNVPIRALPLAEPLQYLDEDAPATNPNDAPRWMRFRTEDGEEGWVREIDTGPYQE